MFLFSRFCLSILMYVLIQEKGCFCCWQSFVWPDSQLFGVQKIPANMKNNQTYKNDFLNEENNYSMSQIFLNTLSIFVTLMTYVQDSISVTFQDIIFLSSYRGQRGLTFFHFHIFPFFKMSFNDIIQFILSKFLPTFIVENIKYSCF